MIAEKLPKEKLGQVKETIEVTTRLVKLMFKVDPLLFTAMSIATILPGIIPFINFYIYKLVIDVIVASVSQSSPIEYTRLFSLIGLRAFTYFLQDTAFITQGFLQKVFWSKVPIKLNEIVLSATAALDMEYFEGSQFTDLLEKVRDSFEWRPQQLVTFFLMGFQSFVQVTIAFVTIASLNLFLAILIAAVAIPEFFNQAQQSKIAWGIWSQHSPHKKRYRYLTWLLQRPRVIKEVKIFKLAETFIKEVTDLMNRFYKDNLMLAKRNYYLSLVFNGFSAVVYIGIEVFVFMEAIARRITVGDIGFYTGVVNNFQGGLNGFFMNLNGVFENSLYIKSLFEVLDAKPLVKQSLHPVKLELQRAPVIEFKNVSFTYPESDKKIFEDFSLTIQPGEKVAFVGENGAGKSTIIKLLARFYDVDKGEILINGSNIKDLDLSNWYHYFGVLFQDFNQYEHTVKENIGFGNVEEKMDLENIIKAASSAGAHSMISKLDKGYEQMLGKTFEEGIELSGGQWQKIALSRAFLKNAPVLVLDEPTAAIDAKAESEIFSRVEKLSKDKTVIIISHRFSTVRNADKIYVIDNGEIVESGSHKELMDIDGQYASLFNLQAKGYQ